MKISELVAQELLKGKKQEEIKLKREGWGNLYFSPRFITASGAWYGLSQNIDAECFPNEEGWTLYEEPRKKKIVYEVDE